jgi:hypothetical protein
MASLTGDRGPQGLAGPQGAVGPQGIPGPQAAAALPSFTTVDGAEVSIAPGDVDAARADCPAGTVVTGVGFYSSIGTVGFAKNYGAFVGIGVINDTSITIDVSAQATCVSTAGAARAAKAPSTAQFDSDLAALK